MTQTIIMTIVLVFACLWQSGRQNASRGGKKMESLMSGSVFTALLAFALVLAFLWQ